MRRFSKTLLGSPASSPTSRGKQGPQNGRRIQSCRRHSSLQAEEDQNFAMPYWIPRGVEALPRPRMTKWRGLKLSRNSSIHHRLGRFHGPGHDGDGIGHREFARLDHRDAAAEAMDVDAIGDFEDMRHV